MDATVNVVMKRLIHLVGLGAIFLSAAFAQQNQNSNGNPPAHAGFVEGRVLVKFRPQADLNRRDTILSEVGALTEEVIPNLELHVLKVPTGRAADAVARAMSLDPAVEFAQVDRYVQPDRIPNDSYFPNEWHLNKISGPAAWDVTTGNSGLIIAVLDTGVDGSHPDLASKMIPGWNVYDNNSNTSDVYGHGTAVAGTFAALSDNLTGVSSVIWNCLIMPLRISDPSGWATSTAVAKALTYAADHGARVANISYAFSTDSTAKTAAQYFQSKGGVVTMSAGNDGAVLASPDNPYVLTVSATTSSDLKASWSTTGNLIDLSAPGVGIYATNRGGGYGSWSGTSFSAPIVAGVAALVISANPNLSPSQVQTILKTSADDLGTAGWDPTYGSGRVNAFRAVNLALSTAGNTTSGDTVAPKVGFGAPLNGNTTSGTMSVQINATDDVGMTSVGFSVDGINWGTDTSSPYTFSLNTLSLTNGTHTLTATAIDTSGNTAAASIQVTVSNVADTTLPIPVITSPSNGATVNGNITVAAKATDNVAVTRFELYIDGAIRATSTASTVSVKWNTRNVTAGPHTLMAKACDAAGNCGITSIVVYR